MTKHVLCYLLIVSLIKVGTIMAGHRHISTNWHGRQLLWPGTQHYVNDSKWGNSKPKNWVSKMHSQASRPKTYADVAWAITFSKCQRVQPSAEIYALNMHAFLFYRASACHRCRTRYCTNSVRLSNAGIMSSKRMDISLHFLTFCRDIILVSRAPPTLQSFSRTPWARA